MKKKHFKFKPLQELYNHGHTLLNTKAVGLSKISLEESAVNQVSAGDLPPERKVKNHRQLLSREANNIPSTSCQSSYSEDLQSLDSTKAPGHLPMLHNVTTSRSTTEHEDHDVFDCQGDEDSCISKDDGAVTISSVHLSGADYKNVRSTAASVSSSCAEVLEKSLNGQSLRISPAAQISSEEGGENLVTANNYSSEVLVPTVVFDGLGSSETSLKDEQDGLDHEISEKTHVFSKTEVVLSDENPPAVALNSFDEIQYLKSDSPATRTQEPFLSSQNIINENGSDELVDVRVCDICGDVGREAFLALCSMCSDGAEHTYCMTPKMEKVPEGDWLCEDCMLMQQPKKQRQAVAQTSDNSSKPSCLKELSQGSPTMNSAVQHFAKRRTKPLSKASCLSEKRHWPAIDVRPEAKKRLADRSVQSLVPGSGVKTRLTQISSLKKMDKGKDEACQVSPFVNLPAKKVMKEACSSGYRSPKPEQQSCRGSVNNSKSLDRSDSNMQVQDTQDMHKKRKSAKKNASNCELKKDRPGKKMPKSLSLTGVGSVQDFSNGHLSVSTIKDVRYGSGRKSAVKLSKKTCQLVSPFAGSGPVNVSSPRTKVLSKVVNDAQSSRKNVEHKNAIQVKGTSSVKAFDYLAHSGKNCVNTFAGSVEERKSPCHSTSYLINSPANIANAYTDQGVSLSTQKPDFGDITRNDNDHSVASYKILPLDFQHVKVKSIVDSADIDHTVPSAISAVPESGSVWKGAFKLEKSGQLPTDCYGVQAHLSTRASSKVVDLVHKFSPELRLKEVPRLHTWPLRFQNNHLTEKDIALYFFAQDLWSYGKSYRMLLEGMRNNDLALEANFGGFQLLVFPSSLLPVRSQCWNSLPFLWGVFRVRKVDDPFLPNLNAATLNQGLHSSDTCRSENKFVSAPVTRSAFVSRTSHSSMDDTESVNPVVLRSPASIKCGDQFLKHQVPSLEEHMHMLKNHHVQADTTLFSPDWRKEDADRGLCNDNLQMHDVGSGSSFSLDSGPAGLSDGRGCAKSAEHDAQVEPLLNPASFNALNLDLSLGSNRSGSEEGVDLDLVLGCPTKSKYQAKGFIRNGSKQDRSVSLTLSLGMSCSNS